MIELHEVLRDVVKHIVVVRELRVQVLVQAKSNLQMLIKILHDDLVKLGGRL